MTKFRHADSNCKYPDLHDLGLIHTDIKLDNILLVNDQFKTFPFKGRIPTNTHKKKESPAYTDVLLDSEIRMIDFGCAVFNDGHHPPVVSPRWYRAPEVILNLGWSYPIDIWCIGCILAELFTGSALFPVCDELEHLAAMQAVTGRKFDWGMIKRVIEIGHWRGYRNHAAGYVFQVLSSPCTRVHL